MKFMNAENVKFAKTMAQGIWVALEEDTAIETETFAKGTKYKAFETQNAGWIIFATDAKRPDGSIPLRRIFRY